MTPATKHFHLSLVLLWLGLQGLYIFTAPPSITFEDTPLFAGACATLGLPHPPGYPFYVWGCYPLTQLYMLLGFSPALGAAAGSAFDAATACVVLALLLHRLGVHSFIAVFSAGVLGLSQSFWDQAQIPEVYALNVLIIVTSWYLCQRLVDDGKVVWVYWLALVLGLGLATHWPLFMLYLPLLVLWVGPRLGDLVRLVNLKVIGICCLLFVLGLSPYLHLLLVSSDAYLFADDYSSADFVAYVSREVYGLGGVELVFTQRLTTALSTLSWFVPQLFYLGGVLAVVGLVTLGRQRNWWQLGAIVWGIVASTFVLAWVRPFDAVDAISVWTFSPYPLPAYAVAAVAMGVGLQRFFATASVPFHSVYASVVVVVVLAVWQLPNFDRRGDFIADTHARLVLQRLPEDALLLVPGGDFDFSIDYAKAFLSPRADIEILRDSEYFDQFGDFATLSVQDEESLAAETRPVAFVQDLSLRQLGIRYRGTHYEVDTAIARGQTVLALDAEAREYLLQLHALAQANPRNAFTQQFVASQIINFVSVATGVQNHGSELSSEDAAILRLFLEMPAGQFAQFLAFVLDNPTPPTLAEIEDRLVALTPYWQELSRGNRADALHVVATTKILAGDLTGGRQLLEAALAEFPSTVNYRVLIDLLQVYATANDFAAYYELRQRFPGLGIHQSLTAYDSNCAAALHKRCTPRVVE